MNELNVEAVQKLETAVNVWVATVRPPVNGRFARPHLSPTWFVYSDGRLYISIDPASVKARNLRRNPEIVLALEEGTHPVICEGTARLLEAPYPVEVVAAFERKYEWNISRDEQYHQLVAIEPNKWLGW